MDCLVLPLQDRLDEWKKTTAQMDKEHFKECKRFRQEWKKRSTMDLADQSIYQSVQQLQQYSPSHQTADTQQSLYGTLRLQKKFRLRSGNNFHLASNTSLSGSNGCLNQLDAGERLLQFEIVERNALKRVLIEERSRFCLFVHYLKGVLDEQLLLTQEVSHLQEVMEQLTRLTADPYAEQVIAVQSSINQKNNFDSNSLYGPIGTTFPAHLASNTPPNSPGSLGSRKSSSCSLSSFNSMSSGGIISHFGNGMQLQQHHQPGSLPQSSLSQNYDSVKANPLVGHHFFPLIILIFALLMIDFVFIVFQTFQIEMPPRVPSITSHDSGFMSNVDLNLTQVCFFILKNSFLKS